MRWRTRDPFLLLPRVAAAPQRGAAMTICHLTKERCQVYSGDHSVPSSESCGFRWLLPPTRRPNLCLTPERSKWQTEKEPDDLLSTA